MRLPALFLLCAAAAGLAGPYEGGRGGRDKTAPDDFNVDEWLKSEKHAPLPEKKEEAPPPAPPRLVPMAPQTPQGVELMSGLRPTEVAQINQTLATSGEVLARQDESTTRNLVESSQDSTGPDSASSWSEADSESGTPREIPNINMNRSPTFEHLRDWVAPQSTQEAQTGNEEHRKEIARAAFEGAAPAADASGVTPGGTELFGIPTHAKEPFSIQDPSPHHDGPPAPEQKGLVIEAPPPPLAIDEESEEDLLEKGVRIEFDVSSLPGAVTLLSDFEDRFASARTLEEVQRALALSAEEAIRQLQPGAELRGLTAVSLRDLAAAGRRMRRRWNHLPFNMRYPGPMRRIHGFVVDPEAEDVLILGTSEGAGEYIDIDDLIVGIESVWKEGRVPICSLDPDPGKVTGPMRSVIQGVRPDSHFARVMLDADYGVKPIALGGGDISLPGFRSLKDYMLEDPRPFMARVWFTPQAPAAGEIRSSPDRRAFIFDTRIQLLTENMAVSGGTFVAAGEEDPVIGEITAALTRAMPELEQRVPVFRQLHALFDITLMATLLRSEGIDFPVLHDIAALPTRDADVPASYPAVNVLLEAEGITLGSVHGGVEIRTTARVQARDRGLRSVAKRVRTAGRLSAALPDITLKTFRGVPAATSGPALMRAAAMLHAGDIAGAQKAVLALMESHPRESALFELRSQIFAERGLYRLADRDLCAAAALAGGDARLRAMRLRLLLDRGTLTVAQIDPDAIEEIADVYFMESVGRVGVGAYDRAIVSVERAIALSPRRTEFHMQRAGIRALKGDAAGALAGYAEVSRLDPADSLPHRATARILGALERWSEAVDAATRAIELDPGATKGYVLRAQARWQANPFDVAEALKDLKQALSLDPKDGEIFLVRARILLGEGDRDGAIADCGRALAAVPGLSEAYSLRAAIRRSSGGDVFDDTCMALLLNPSDAAALIMRAEVLQRVAGDREIMLERISEPRFRRHLTTLTALHPESVKQISPDLDSLDDLGEEPEQLLDGLRRCICDLALHDYEAAVSSGLPPAEVKRISPAMAELRSTLEKGNP